MIGIRGRINNEMFYIQQIKIKKYNKHFTIKYSKLRSSIMTIIDRGNTVIYIRSIVSLELKSFRLI